ncbi:mechanosensitive ion channel family protein [Terriglobus aquaticus]|uniref:mechanosensitive ion channel family protein n=1 Tax=Terriglobus aquaticus TaxID=940139 RepID=UPI0031DD5900
MTGFRAPNFLRYGAFCVSLFLSVSWAQSPSPASTGGAAAPAAPVSASTAAVTAATAATAAAATPAANGAQPGQPTAPSPQTASKIAALPAPFPPGLIQGIDIPAQSRAILSHLSEIVRYYRMTAVPIQKLGEPSDVLYAQQTQAEAMQIGQTAFKAARSQAAFLARIPNPKASPGDTSSPPPQEANKIAEVLRNNAQRLSDLQTQDASLTQQIAHARAAQRGTLLDQQGDLEGQIKLLSAVVGALQKVALTSTANQGGLQGNIDQLQKSVPELVNSSQKTVPATVESIASIRDAGVTTQGTVLFQLLSTERAIDERVKTLQMLHDQADDLRKPLLDVLKATMAESQRIAADTGASTADLASKRKTYDALADAFTTLSDVAVPLSQEVLLLEQAQATYGSWRASVASTESTVLHALLVRVVLIALALGVIFAFGELWRRATTRYVQDTRRRRQILLIRRIVIGFLTGLVLIFGFVTQFSSLATFAGFISAGIAVGLQTILLSVAAYFFIVGRYGVRVGDRITVAGVTGEVVEVGLVRFYMLELTGTGTELHTTGRVAVFANSVLFQTGTPLYKQIPGTEYAWHELTLKFKPVEGYEAALKQVQGIVQGVFETYKAKLEAQHRSVETWLDTAIQAPEIESRLQLTDAPQFAVLYPVEIEHASEVDQQIIQALLRATAQQTELGQVIDGTPTVKAVVKS